MSMVYKTILSHLHSAFCSSFHTYHERIRLIPSPLSPSCGLEPHTTVHVFSCSSHPIPLSPDRDRPVCLSWSGISPFLWCSASSSPSFSPSGGQESQGHVCLYFSLIQLTKFQNNIYILNIHVSYILPVSTAFCLKLAFSLPCSLIVQKYRN